MTWALRVKTELMHASMNGTIDMSKNYLIILQDIVFDKTVGVIFKINQEKNEDEVDRLLIYSKLTVWVCLYTEPVVVLNISGSEVVKKLIVQTFSN